MEHEYLVMKLGYINGIDFYKEHMSVIGEFGYVDLARAGKKYLDFSRIEEPYFFIKESVKGGNRVFKAFVYKDGSIEKHVPDYYAHLNLKNASWIRINRLEVVNKDLLLEKYKMKNGKDIKALDKGAVSYFFITDAVIE